MDPRMASNSFVEVISGDLYSELTGKLRKGTHPDVRRFIAAHLRVAKSAVRGRASTLVDRLDPSSRREEIARMLAGETVTEAARAAADDLLRAMA